MNDHSIDVYWGPSHIRRRVGSSRNISVGLSKPKRNSDLYALVCNCSIIDSYFSNLTEEYKSESQARFFGSSEYIVSRRRLFYV